MIIPWERSKFEIDQKFECPLCKVKLSQKRNLKRHIAMVHKETKSFKCPVCEMTFTNKTEGRQHIIKVHNAEKPFECSLCPSKFSRKSDLSKHYQRKHTLSRIVPESKVKPYQKIICY